MKPAIVRISITQLKNLSWLPMAWSRGSVVGCSFAALRSSFAESLMPARQVPAPAAMAAAANRSKA